MTHLVTELSADKFQRGGRVFGGALDLKYLPADIEIALIGDLHARKDNFQKYVKALGEGLEYGCRILVFLGDIVHSESAIDIYDMKPSIEMMRAYADFKLQYPRQVFALLGNHDPLNGGAARGAFGQVNRVAIYKERLQYYFGESYIHQYERMIELSPVILLTKQVVAVHAGPAAEGTIDDIKRWDVYHDVPPRR